MMRCRNVELKLISQANFYATCSGKLSKMQKVSVQKRPWYTQIGQCSCGWWIEIDVFTMVSICAEKGIVDKHRDIWTCKFMLISTMCVTLDATVGAGEYWYTFYLIGAPSHYPMTNDIWSVIVGVGENCSPPPALVLLNNACGLGICSH